MADVLSTPARSFCKLQPVAEQSVGGQTVGEIPVGVPPSLSTRLSSPQSVGQHASRFESPLARVLFVDPDLPGAVRATAAQQRLVRRVVVMIEAADEGQLHAMIRPLEQRVLPVISAESMLELACAIQRKAQWMLQSMPRLGAHSQRLRRAEEMASAFGQDNLIKLAQALQQETAR